MKKARSGPSTGILLDFYAENETLKRSLSVDSTRHDEPSLWVEIPLRPRTRFVYPAFVLESNAYWCRRFSKAGKQCIYQGEGHASNVLRQCYGPTTPLRAMK